MEQTTSQCDNNQGVVPNFSKNEKTKTLRGPSKKELWKIYEQELKENSLKWTQKLEQDRDLANHSNMKEPQTLKKREQKLQRKEQVVLLDESKDLPVKKAQSAYVLFGKKKREEILKENPKMKVTDVVKEIAHQWQQLGKQERSLYKAEAKKDKVRYENEVFSFMKESNQYERPKKPLTPYMFFVRETRKRVQKEMPDIAALDIMKEVGRIWQRISKTELQKYEQLAAKDMVRYQKEHAQFIKKINLEREKNKPSALNEQEEEKTFGGASALSSIWSQVAPAQISQKLPRENIYQRKAKGYRRNSSERLSLSRNRNASSASSSQRLDQSGDIPYLKELHPSEPKKPKKPLSAYIYFSQVQREKFKQQNPKWSTSEIMKKVSNYWNKLKPEAKEEFHVLAIQDKERYDREVAEQNLMSGSSSRRSSRKNSVDKGHNCLQEASSSSQSLLSEKLETNESSKQESPYQSKKISTFGMMARNKKRPFQLGTPEKDVISDSQHDSIPESQEDSMEDKASTRIRLDLELLVRSESLMEYCRESQQLDSFTDAMVDDEIESVKEVTESHAIQRQGSFHEVNYPLEEVDGMGMLRQSLELQPELSPFDEVQPYGIFYTLVQKSYPYEN